jgi:hypothetical protein
MQKKIISQLVDIITTIFDQNKTLYIPHEVKDLSVITHDCIQFNITIPYEPYGSDDYYVNQVRVDFNLSDELVLQYMDDINHHLKCCDDSIKEEKRLAQLRKDTLNMLTPEQKKVLGLK